MNTGVTRDQNSYETKLEMLQEITDLKKQLALSESETLKIGEWYNQSLIREEDLKEDMLELQTKLTDTEKRLEDAIQRLDFGFENALWKQDLQKKEDESNFWKEEAQRLSWQLFNASDFNREQYWEDALKRLEKGEL